MDDQELRWFVALANRPNVTAVALDNYISQSALSRAIVRVESYFGAELFDRYHGRLRLNQYGAIVNRCAQRAISDLEMAKVQIRELASPECGEIRLLSANGIGSWFLPMLINRFQKLVPGSRFDLISNSLNPIEYMLSSGRADLALTTAPLNQQDVNWQVLYKEELFVALPLGHALANEVEIRLKDLADEKFVVTPHNTEWRQMVDTLIEGAGFSMRIAFETSARQTIRRFVAGGLGISFLPRPHDTNLQAVEIVYVPIMDGPFYSEVGIAWLSDQTPNPVTAVFLDYLLHEHIS